MWCIKNRKAIPFVLLALSLGQQKELYRKNVFLFRWLNNSRLRSKKKLMHCWVNNIGPISKFANLKVLNSLVYQQLIIIGPTLTLIFSVNVLYAMGGGKGQIWQLCKINVNCNLTSQKCTINGLCSLIKHLIFQQTYLNV